MEFSNIEATFVDIGGQFITSAFDMREKLMQVKAYLFDWDGVFNDGRKGENTFSGFSEVDSLGVSMLRFSHFLVTGELPLTAVISGEENPSALLWARREHIHAVYLNTKEKQKALSVFSRTHGVKTSEICYFFDDILDIPVAQQAGIRMAVGRLSNPVFLKYLEDHHLADYISACQGNEHAVREFCELLLMLHDKHFEVIERRAAFDREYQSYLTRRESISTNLYRYDHGNIISVKE